MENVPHPSMYFVNFTCNMYSNIEAVSEHRRNMYEQNPVVVLHDTPISDDMKNRHDNASVVL